MKKIFNILDLGVAIINKNIAVVGIALGVLLTFINVVLRYSVSVFESLAQEYSFLNILFKFFTHLNNHMTWAGELTNYLFIWSALFGAAYGFKKGIHISVTIMLNVFPAKLGKALLIISHIISFVYLLLSSYLGYLVIKMVAEFGEMSVDLRIPMWIPQLVLPIAFFTASFRAGEKAYEVLKTPANQVLFDSEAELVHDSVTKD